MKAAARRSKLAPEKRFIAVTVEGLRDSNCVRNEKDGNARKKTTEGELCLAYICDV